MNWMTAFNQGGLAISLSPERLQTKPVTELLQSSHTWVRRPISHTSAHYIASRSVALARKQMTWCSQSIMLSLPSRPVLHWTYRKTMRKAMQKQTILFSMRSTLPAFEGWILESITTNQDWISSGTILSLWSEVIDTTKPRVIYLTSQTSLRWQ